MRRGCNDVAFIEDNGVFIGVNLGWDFTAEHERGIEGIRNMFNMDDNPEHFGIVRRTVQAVPGPDRMRLVDVNNPKGALLICAHLYGELPKDGRGYPFDELALYDKQELAGAWDGDDFGIFATVTHRAKLQELYDAFQRKDVAIFLGRSGPFSNGGLKLVIASRLPKEVTDAMYAADADNFRMKKAAKATGIEDYLKTKGMKWFALSPRWANEEKTEVKFWLNPYDQHIYEAGWFTVDQLKQWADGKGPVIKKQKAAWG